MSVNFSPCVLIPCYNHGAMMPGVLARLKPFNLPCIVVDDGSDAATQQHDAPRDKCTLSCAINGIHAAFHYLKKNYISGCVMTVPTGW